MSTFSNIELKDITFSYQKDKSIIQNLSLDIPSGFSLLVGPTGCGKSTLLKIIANLYPKFAGQLTGSVNLHGQKAGMMFQNAGEQFTMRTPYEEMIFALENLEIDPASAKKRINEACAFTQIDTLLNQTINTLSGGEKQRVALAVLIAMNTDIYLLDEPFASCDPESRKFLINKLANLKTTGKTIIISDHQLADYQGICDRVYQFKNKDIHLLKQDQLNALFETDSTVKNFNFALPKDPSETLFLLKNTQIKLSRLLLSQDKLSIPNKNIVIVGPNGSGKTSFFKALTKMIPYSGQIKFRDCEIRKMSTRKYLQHVAQIFQDANEQFLTIKLRDEIELSKKYRNNYFTDSVIDHALKELDLDSHIDQVIYTLSGGQKKKLQILLMLICQHDVLLIDEPLAGLDHDSIKQICQLLLNSQKKVHKSFIFISHQLTGLADICDYCLKYDEQRLSYISEVSE